MGRIAVPLVEPCARRTAAVNLWAPPPTFDDRCTAAENFTAPRRCHVCCIFRFLRKVFRKFLGWNEIFSGILKTLFWPPARAVAAFLNWRHAGTADQN